MIANLREWFTSTTTSFYIKYKEDISALTTNIDLCRYRDNQFVGSLGGREVVMLDDVENACERIMNQSTVYAGKSAKILSLAAVITVFISKTFAILAAIGAVCCGTIFLLAYKKLATVLGEQAVIRLQKDIYDGIVKYPKAQGQSSQIRFDSRNEAERQKYVPIIYHLYLGEFMHPNLKRFRKELVLLEILESNPLFGFGQPYDQVVDSIQCL